MWQSVAADSCDICQCSPRSKRGENSFLDKENVPQSLSPVKNEDLSFYGSTSPSTTLCSGTSPNHCGHGFSRRPFEDQDPNSRDSGYITNYNGESGKFSSCTSPSFDPMEDDFFEDIRAIEVIEDNLPQNFNKLITAPITCKNRNNSPKDLAIRPLFRRALSFQNEKIASNVRHCLFKPADCRPFKRPEPPQQILSPTSTKKLKVGEDEEVRSVPTIARPLLQRHFSATEESIMSAVQRSSVEPDLIGDFSKTFCLPLTQGRHQDLKSITSETLAKLIRGDFDGNVASFKVIDCRYPYEFQGGHIGGAVNVFTKEQCLELFNNMQTCSQSDKRSNILVFHCEFSSERGPNLYRYLREQDRQRNLDTYPSLHYPEVYLLEGGYKNFFEQFSDLCVPIAYTEMLHPKHKNELLYFRLKSKTWNVDTRQRSKGRANIKRLEL